MPSSTTGPQRSNVTHWNGNAASFAGGSGLPFVAAVRAIKHFNISFGTGESGDKVTSIGGLGAVDAEEVVIIPLGPFHVTAPDNSEWSIGCRVTSATDVTFTKYQITNGAYTPAPSTHYFIAIRMVK
jgi:hypothetical protein